MSHIPSAVLRFWPTMGSGGWCLRRCPARPVFPDLFRRRFQDSVGVGAADAKRAHSGTIGILARREVGNRIGDIEWRVRQVDTGTDLPKIDGRRDFVVLQRQRDLDRAGKAGSHIEVTDIALHRAEAAELLPRRMLSERPAQRRKLDRIAQRRTGAVRFDIANGLRINRTASKARPMTSAWPWTLGA